MNPLESLARRLQDDPLFLACPLHLYARSEGLDDAGLARRLGCPMEKLPELRLCRQPREESLFRRDITEIADFFGLDRGVLAEAVKRGQVLLKFAQQTSSERGVLLAARDGEPASDPPEEEP